MVRSSEKKLKIFVPGRICLFGEHSDWAGGYRRSNPALGKGLTIVCGTNQGITGEVSTHPDRLILSSVTASGETFGPYTIPMQLEMLLAEAQKGIFWSYICGVAYQILLRYPVSGLVIHNDHTDLPIKKGLSSSAAICVLAARAFNQMYNLGLSLLDEMELAYLGEITTPSRCGRMDQACAFGSTPVLMTFDADHLVTEPLQVGANLYYVIVDLCAGKDTLKILRQLNACYPFAQNVLQQNVQTLLGTVNQRITHAAVEAIRRGDAASLGGLMHESQSNFDRCAIPACPDELTAPVLHRTLAYPAIQPYIWGGKGIGSQGDGSAQFLARGEAEQAAVIEIFARDAGLPSLALTIQRNI